MQLSNQGPLRANWHALLSLLVLGSAMASCTGDDRSTIDASVEDSPPPLVRVERIGLRQVRRLIDTTGTLESERRVTVLPEVAGRLIEVLVDEGDSTQSDAVIARLDARQAVSALEQTKVQLEDRRVRLELQRLEAESAKAQIEQARIEANRTATELERNKAIDPGLIPLKQLQEAEFSAQAAAEALRVSEYQSRKADLEVRAAEAAIRELEARVREAELRVDQHSIRSPIDGLVATANVRGGETVGAATELFELVDPSNLIAYLRRPQRELSLIRRAEQVQFTTDAFPDRTFTARIDLISPTLDETSGSFRIRVRVAPEDTEVLRPGMFVRAKILTEAEREALMVPKTAVLNEGADSVVFAIRDGIAQRVVIDRGLEEREYVEARNLGADGLRVGDLIVTSGQHSLENNQAVEVAHTARANTDTDDPQAESDDKPASTSSKPPRQG